MLMCLKSNWNWKCWFLRRAKNWSTLRKTSWSNDKNKQQTLPSCHQCQDLNQGHTLMGGNCAPLTSWVPNLNIYTLIPYTVYYQFFLILVAPFSLFLLTLMTCMFDQARIILTRRNEIPMTFVTVHYTFSLTAWLSPDLPFGGMGTMGLTGPMWSTLPSLPIPTTVINRHYGSGHCQRVLHP